MDKLVDHIFALEGDGKLKDFPGNYTQYRNWKEAKEAESNAQKQEKSAAQKSPTKSASAESLTYEDRKQLRNWEKKIDRLTADKMKLSESFAQEGLTGEEMKDLSKQIKTIDDQIEEAEMQWMSLAEKA
jgi:ATP-binding cassette subfamily F protein uup